MSFSTEIKKFRQTFGLTQAEVADKAGIAPAVLSRIENDEVVPQLKTKHKIHKAMKEYNFKSFIDEEEGLKVQKRMSIIDCLDFNKKYEVEPSVAFGFDALVRHVVTTKINGPIFDIGDTIFADQQQFNFSQSEGWYIFHQIEPKRTFVAYSTPSHNFYGEEAYLSFNSDLPDIGWVKASQFEALGKIVRVVKIIHQ
jgi:transcriptional regulator with XRE-family HTH domain